MRLESESLTMKTGSVATSGSPAPQPLSWFRYAVSGHGPKVIKRSEQPDS
jgi:hypothetical protein